MRRSLKPSSGPHWPVAPLRRAGHLLGLSESRLCREGSREVCPRTRPDGGALGACLLALLAAPAVAGQPLAELSLDRTVVIAPGKSASAHIVIALDPDVQLFGYSLAVEIVPKSGAIGSVVIDLETATDPATTNLGLAQNLIAAYPAPLDPVFTVLWPDGPNGIFVNANIDFLNPSAPDYVTVNPFVNDVLLELVFDASSGALGSFDVMLGKGSAISDADGFAVPFTWLGATIVVDATPAPLARSQRRRRRQRG
jgi:hypothetical protein